jgi:hypothetical protein
VAAPAIAANDINGAGHDDVLTTPPAFHTPLAEHFNETTWSSVPSSNVSTASRTLRAVTAIRTETVVALGTAIIPPASLVILSLDD